MTGTLEAELGPEAVTITLQEEEGDPPTALPLNRIGPVRIRRGRTGLTGTPEPSTCSFPIYESGLPFPAQLGQLLTVELGPDAIAALGIAADDPAIPRFKGTITDATVRPRRFDAINPPPNVFDLVATARWARLDGTGKVIGDEPWPEETDTERALRVILATDYFDFGVGAVDGTGTATVLARDVDAQPPLRLLADLARDARGTLDETRDGTLTYHPFQHRADPTRAFGAHLHNVELVTGSTWATRLAEVKNRAEVVFGPPPDPRAEVYVDLLASQARFGVILERVESQLAAVYDAYNLAAGLVALSQLARYLVAGLAVDAIRTTTTPGQRRALFRLETSDAIHTPDVPITGVFGSGSSGGYDGRSHFLEGWTETIHRNGWEFALAVSPWFASWDTYHTPLADPNLGPSYDQLQAEGITYDQLQAEGITYDQLQTDERTS